MFEAYLGNYCSSFVPLLTSGSFDCLRRAVVLSAVQTTAPETLYSSSHSCSDAQASTVTMIRRGVSLREMQSTNGMMAQCVPVNIGSLSAVA